MKRPFFSVIIPTYNRARSILDAVESVLSQTFQDFELIIIDDGSTDNTSEILKPVLARDERIKYVYQENAERSAARNHGIEIATGEYICFLDSDDEYLPEHLVNFHRSILKCDGKGQMLFCKTIQNPNDVVSDEWRKLTECDSEQEFVLLNALTSQQACIPSDLLNNYRFNTKMKIGEDRDLWLQIAAESEIKKLQTATVLIKDLGDRTVELSNLDNAHENLKNLRQSLEQHASEVSRKVKNKAIAAAYYRLAQSYGANGLSIKAIVHALISIILFRDKYTKSIIMFILQELSLRQRNLNSVLP